MAPAAGTCSVAAGKLSPAGHRADLVRDGAAPRLMHSVVARAFGTETPDEAVVDGWARELD